MEYERYFNNIHKQTHVSHDNYYILEWILLSVNIFTIAALLGFAFDWFTDPVADALRKKVASLESELDNTENTLDVLEDELDEKNEKIRLLEEKLENLRDVLSATHEDEDSVTADTQG